MLLVLLFYQLSFSWNSRVSYSWLLNANYFIWKVVVETCLIFALPTVLLSQYLVIRRIQLEILRRMACNLVVWNLAKLLCELLNFSLCESLPFTLLIIRFRGYATLSSWCIARNIRALLLARVLVTTFFRLLHLFFLLLLFNHNGIWSKSSSLVSPKRWWLGLLHESTVVVVIHHVLPHVRVKEVAATMLHVLVSKART